MANDALAATEDCSAHVASQNGAQSSKPDVRSIVKNDGVPQQLVCLSPTGICGKLLLDGLARLATHFIRSSRVSTNNKHLLNGAVAFVSRMIAPRKAHRLQGQNRERCRFKGSASRVSIFAQEHALWQVHALKKVQRLQQVEPSVRNAARLNYRFGFTARQHKQ